MKISDIIIITKGKINKKYIDKEIKSIKLDSREIEDGDVFICINSGYKYISDAIDNGAVAIITDKIDNGYNLPIIKVNDTIQALGLLGKYMIDNYSGVVIAITGSNGKTTTKELLAHILSSRAKVLKNDGSENNYIGVPKTLFRLNNSYDYLVIEIGMNHFKEIEYLSKMLTPDIGIITNIGTAHIGLLGSKENIFLAKSEILLGNPNMKLFLNGNDEYLKKLHGSFVYENDYDNIFINEHCPIDYVLATKVSETLGYSLDKIIESLKDFNLPKSRMKEICINGKIIIDDSYNASYESIIEGIKYLSKYKTRKIMILGDVLELGHFSKKIHQDIIGYIKNYKDIILFTYGEITREIVADNNFINMDDLRKYFRNFSFINNDIIYLKGSNKMKLYSLVPYFEELLK